MKFYNSEGRCIRQTADSDFGWNRSALDLSDSDEFEVTYPSIGMTTVEDKISVYDPKVPVYVAKNCVECIVDETPNTTTKIESGLISNETLADLIQGDSLEAKTLLSVFNPQEASQEQANFTSKTKVLNDLRSVSQVQSSDDLYGHQSIGSDLHYQGCFKNTLSLMEELTLAEQGTKQFMFGQSMEQDSGIDCGDGFLMQNDELQDSVMECDYQTLRLQQEVRVLRKEYKIELERTEDLIKGTVNLEKDLRKTLFLDKLLRLLQGNTDKVSFSNCPFKILSSSSKSNLIV